MCAAPACVRRADVGLARSGGAANEWQAQSESAEASRCCLLWESLPALQQPARARCRARFGTYGNYCYWSEIERGDNGRISPPLGNQQVRAWLPCSLGVARAGHSQTKAGIGDKLP